MMYMRDKSSSGNRSILYFSGPIHFFLSSVTPENVAVTSPPGFESAGEHSSAGN